MELTDEQIQAIKDAAGIAESTAKQWREDTRIKSPEEKTAIALNEVWDELRLLRAEIEELKTRDGAK